MAASTEATSYRTGNQETSFKYDLSENYESTLISVDKSTKQCIDDFLKDRNIDMNFVYIFKGKEFVKTEIIEITIGSIHLIKMGKLTFESKSKEIEEYNSKNLWILLCRVERTLVEELKYIIDSAKIVTKVNPDIKIDELIIISNTTKEGPKLAEITFARKKIIWEISEMITFWKNEKKKPLELKPQLLDPYDFLCLPDAKYPTIFDVDPLIKWYGFHPNFYIIVNTSIYHIKLKPYKK